MVKNLLTFHYLSCGDLGAFLNSWVGHSLAAPVELELVVAEKLVVAELKSLEHAEFQPAPA